MTIDRGKFQQRARTMPDHLANADKLVPGSLRGGKFAILTISEVVQIDARRPNRRRDEPEFETAIVLAFKEFPNRIYWLNKMSVNILCDVYGDDETKWIGERVPLVVKEKVKNPGTQTYDDMLWVANADEWEKLFADEEEARAAFARGQKPATDVAPVAAENAAAKAARAAAEKRKLKDAAAASPPAGNASA